jgi:hypothetical protein
MRSTLLLLTFLLTFGTILAQTALLDKYDFSQGDHTIIMLPHQRNTFSGQVDTTAVVAYFDQVATQNAFKKTLVVARPVESKASVGCSDYLSINVCKNGKAIESLMISDGCQSIANRQGEFQYSGYLPLKGYKLAHRTSHAFKTLTQAREGLDSLRNLPDIILVPEPEWHHFDGKLCFTRPMMGGTLHAFIDQTQKEISKRFPNQGFQIRVDTGKGGYDVQLWCTTAMQSQFDLYPKSIKQWRPFSRLTLDSYHRTE